MAHNQKVIIFDIDGTLLDTREYIFQGFEHALKKCGLPARHRVEIASQIGKKLNDCYVTLAPGAAFEPLREAHDAFQAENLGLVRQFESVSDTLSGLREAGYGLALWTGRGHNVIESLEAAAVDTALFEMIIDPTHVPVGKPDPAGIRHIITSLNVAAANVVMVGDAAVDIIAGKRAGVGKTIGITHGFGTRDELEQAGADRIVDTFSDVLPAVC